MDKLDKQIILSLLNFFERHKLLKQLCVITTKLSSKLFITIYLYVLFFAYKTNNINLIIFPFVTLLITIALQKIFFRKRPFEELGIENDTKHENSSSFPSKHSSSAFVIGMSCLYINSLFGILMLLLAIITGLSRIFCFVHYPTDVMIGMVIGISFGTLLFIL